MNKNQNVRIPGSTMELDGITITGIRSTAIGSIFVAETDYGIPVECPDCHIKLHKHSTKTTTVHHTPFNGKPCDVEIKKTRKICPSCGKLFYCSELPFCDSSRNITKQLEKKVIELGMETTFTHAQKELGISDSTAERILENFIEEKDASHKFELPYAMGLDEVKIGKTYRTTVTNLQKRTLVDFLERRDGKFLEETFRKKYSEAERAMVRWVCTDMYRPFEKPLQTLFPSAQWIIDHFHVVKMANECVEEICRNLQNKLDDPKLAKGIKKRLRYVLLKRNRDFTREDDIKLEMVRLAIPELVQAYGIKEDFYDIYDNGTKEEAQNAFAAWEDNLPEGDLFLPFKKLAKTVHAFYDPIFRFWDSGRITNGYTECANNLARCLDRKARGLRFKILRGKLLYNEKALQAGTFSGKEYGANTRVFVSTLTGEVFYEKPEDDDVEEIDVPF